MLQVGILSAQHELQVELVVKLANDCAIEADAACSATLHLSGQLMHLLNAFYLDPATGAQGSPHSRVPNRFTKVLDLSL